MAFFSNPKRKEYVLNPRGKALYENSNNFGTKMLEKMGWSKGKGLGAKLDGQVDFIKVAHKSDQKGVGFQDRDDQWTSHENNFNSLLKSFKSAGDSEEESEDFVKKCFRNDNNGMINEEVEKRGELISGVSLEEQSKKSRSRVHYKKFTRGKDITRYSEKDLANIFGKKSLICNVEIESADSVSNDAMTDGKTPNFGITTIESGTTINEYFKMKMKKNKGKSGDLIESSENSMNENLGTAETKKEKKPRKKLKADGTESAPENILKNGHLSSCQEVAEESPQKHETSAKREHKDDDVEQTQRSKKKKKRKATIDAIVDIIDDQPEIIGDERLTSKKSKKAKLLSTSIDRSVELAQDVSMNKRSDVPDVPNLENRDCLDVINDNIYEIRSYRAEIFRYVDLHAFSGSTLCDIAGYGYTSDMTLKIVDRPEDCKKINTLWNETLDKYANLKDGSKKNKKRKFVEHIKDLKKKSIFKI